jgi:hypothetical protein
LFAWLAVEAKKRGYGRKRTVLLADPAEAIWDLQKLHFPDAEVCLDWYHVAEKVWAVGRCIHPEGSGSAALTAWVASASASCASPAAPAR